MNRLTETINFEATLATSKRHPLLKVQHCLLLLFNAFSAERLVRGIWLYQIVGD